LGFVVWAKPPGLILQDVSSRSRICGAQEKCISGTRTTFGKRAFGKSTFGRKIVPYYIQLTLLDEKLLIGSFFDNSRGKIGISKSSATNFVSWFIYPQSGLTLNLPKIDSGQL